MQHVGIKIHLQIAFNANKNKFNKIINPKYDESVIK